MNEDFHYYNDNLRNENDKKKKNERNSFVTDKLDFFPFTSGDLIEKHRESLGAQLKNDLRSFMDYSKQHASPRTTRYNNELDTLSKVESVFSNRDKRFKPLKMICDTDYVRPDENNLI